MKPSPRKTYMRNNTNIDAAETRQSEIARGAFLTNVDATPPRNSTELGKAEHPQIAINNLETPQATVPMGSATQPIERHSGSVIDPTHEQMIRDMTEMMNRNLENE